MPSIFGSALDLFALVSMTISLLLAGGLLALWLHWRTLRYLRPLAVTFLLEAAGEVFMILRAHTSSRWSGACACITLSVAAYLLNDACIQRLRGPGFRRELAAVAAGIMAVYLFFLCGPDNGTLRIDVENFGFGAMMLIGAWQIRHGARRWHDRLLLGTLTCFGLQFFVRPLLTMHGAEHPFTTRSFQDSDLWLWTNVCILLFQALFTLAIIAAVLGDLVGKLTRDASTDWLTGLVNRREFERIAGLERAHGPRVQCLVLCDADRFKHINDTLGHRAGDEVLQRIATLLRDKVRSGDTVARIGGEEFALLLPGMSLGEAAALCERLRHSIEKTSLAPRREALSVTASFGVIAREPYEPLADALERADRALYVAKREGRNRIVAHSAPDPQYNETAEPQPVESQVQ